MVGIVDGNPNEPLSDGDLCIIKQWFGAVSDLNPHYLKSEDYRVVVKILGKLNLPIPETFVELGK